MLNKIYAFALLAISMPIGAANAQGVQLPGPNDTVTNTGGIIVAACTIFNYMFLGLLLLGVLFVLLAAYRYLTAAGDPENVTKANRTLIYAAVAIAVSLFARALPVLIGNFVLGDGAGSGFDVCS